MLLTGKFRGLAVNLSEDPAKNGRIAKKEEKSNRSTDQRNHVSHLEVKKHRYMPAQEEPKQLLQS